MKILIDMNLSPLRAPFLSLHGIESLHWSSIGRASTPDTEILDYAAQNGFVMFTHDLDFGMLLAARKALGPERDSGADTGCPSVRDRRRRSSRDRGGPGLPRSRGHRHCGFGGAADSASPYMTTAHGRRDAPRRGPWAVRDAIR
jgi:hypothetical protein